MNPPVQAWAALEVFAIDGGRDLDFLSRILDKLMINFTWWVNREDADGSNLFEGGFLGLDNIGPIDRSHLPPGDLLQQADATGWMGFYALTLAGIAAILNRSQHRPTEDLVVKFIEHFTLISRALDDLGLYDEEQGMYFDRLHLEDGTAVMLEVHSMGGIIPLLASVILDQSVLDQAEQLGKGFASYYRDFDPQALRKAGVLRGEQGDEQLLLGMVGIDQFLRLVARMFDEGEFLSPYGLRALSAYHRESPFVLSAEGFTGSIDYEPAESTTAMFGGNSNWRGPVWFPLNYLVCSALERYGTFLGPEVRVAFPTGSDDEKSLSEIAHELRRRNIALFLKGDDGRRPIFGGRDKMQTDRRWADNIFFNEYFNGDTGEGLGASHQTGWTGLVADQIRRLHNPDLPSPGGVARLMGEP